MWVRTTCEEFYGRKQALDVTAFDSETPLFFSELFLFQLSVLISKEERNKFIDRESFHLFSLPLCLPISFYTVIQYKSSGKWLHFLKLCGAFLFFFFKLLSTSIIHHYYWSLMTVCCVCFHCSTYNNKFTGGNSFNNTNLLQTNTDTNTGWALFYLFHYFFCSGSQDIRLRL